MYAKKNFQSKRKLVVGDIHGELWKLVHLMSHVHYKPHEDQLVFLGDYVDRGPHSAQVISQLREYQSAGAIILKGNHDIMFSKAVLRARMEDLKLWHANDYEPTEKSYKQTNEKYREEHAKWIEKLPFWFEDDEYFYSHAPVCNQFPHSDLAKSDEKSLTWNYVQEYIGETEASCAKKLDTGKIGVCGHIHSCMFEPRFYPHYIYVDTGCGCFSDAPLTCVDLTNNIYYQSNGTIKEFDRPKW